MLSIVHENNVHEVFSSSLLFACRCVRVFSSRGTQGEEGEDGGDDEEKTPTRTTVVTKRVQHSICFSYIMSLTKNSRSMNISR